LIDPSLEYLTWLPLAVVEEGVSPVILFTLLDDSGVLKTERSLNSFFDSFEFLFEIPLLE
jgi:hypothetical protein